MGRLTRCQVSNQLLPDLMTSFALRRPDRIRRFRDLLALETFTDVRTTASSALFYEL